MKFEFSLTDTAGLRHRQTVWVSHYCEETRAWQCQKLIHSRVFVRFGPSSNIKARFFYFLTNHLQTPRRQRSSDWSCIVIFWVKCCVFRLKLFELIRTKFTFFKTNNKLFMPPPNINQSIFYAMLRWSKDNPNSHNFKWPKPPSSLSFQSLCCRFNTLPLGSQCLLDKILFFLMGSLFHHWPFAKPWLPLLCLSSFLLSHGTCAVYSDSSKRRSGRVLANLIWSWWTLVGVTMVTAFSNTITNRTEPQIWSGTTWSWRQLVDDVCSLTDDHCRYRARLVTF